MGEVVRGQELAVRRDDIGEAQVRGATWDPGPDEVLVAVGTIGLTSNNVTYAVLGEELRYWRAYPAGEDDLGIVPAWGFGRVVASDVGGVPVGERLWGLWPMATHAVLRPGRVDGRGLVDASPHREGLAGTYQRYERVAEDPLHDPATAHLEPLYRPLFGTAFLLDDLLADAAAIGADVATVVVTSASSRTATALAHLLARRDVEVVGVTSAARAAHVDSDGLVDRVVAYEQVGSLAVDGPAVLVDVAGRPAVAAAIGEALGDDLVATLAVGLTHHDAADAEGATGEPSAPTFFAPSRAAQRVHDWGPAVLVERITAAWRPFAAWVDERVAVREVVGVEALATAWSALVAGEVDPGEGVLAVLDR